MRSYTEYLGETEQPGVLSTRSRSVTGRRELQGGQEMKLAGR